MGIMKKVTGLVALAAIYRSLTKPFTEHAFYKAGIIDKDGKKIIPKAKGMDEWSNFNIFTWKMMKVVDKHPILKYSLVTAAVSGILMKESYSAEYTLAVKTGTDEVVFVKKQDDFHSASKSVELISESGVMITSESNVRMLTGEEIVTGKIAGNGKKSKASKMLTKRSQLTTHMPVDK